MLDFGLARQYTNAAGEIRQVSKLFVQIICLFSSFFENILPCLLDLKAYPKMCFNSIVLKHEEHLQKIAYSKISSELGVINLCLFGVSDAPEWSTRCECFTCRVARFCWIVFKPNYKHCIYVCAKFILQLRMTLNGAFFCNSYCTGQ